MTPPRIDDFELPDEGLPSWATSPTPRGAQPWPPAAKVAVGIGSGCAVIVLLEFVAIWVGVEAMFGARAPEGFAVQATAPKRAAVGTKVPLTLTVRNQGEQAFTVRSLAARGSTLGSYRIENAQPASQIAPVSLFGSTVWTYEQSVAPGKSWTVRFDATPLKAGTARGVLEVQVGKGARSAAFTIDAQQGAAPAPKPLAKPPPAPKRE